MNILKKYLTDKKININSFAASIKKTTTAVRRYTSGDRIPEKETMRDIYKVTHGEVQPNDFYDLPPL